MSARLVVVEVGLGAGVGVAVGAGGGPAPSSFVRAGDPSVGFPQKMDRFPRERIWVVAHKTVAVAAGLGVMGLHRNVIHPKFGSFVLLATVLVDAEVSEYGQALETLYALPGSHAQEYARRRFPHEPVKEVTGGWQPPAKRSAAS